MESATLATRASSSSCFPSRTANLNPVSGPASSSTFKPYTRPPSSSSLNPLRCCHNPIPGLPFPSKPDSSRGPGACSAVKAPPPVSVSDQSRSKLDRLVSEFHALPDPLDRVKRLLDYATLLPRLPDSDRVQSNRVMGCTAQVWLSAEMDPDGRMRFAADSDSEVTRGFCACLVGVLDGAFPDEVLSLRTEDIGELNVGFSGKAHSRANTWHNVLVSMQKRTKGLVMQRQGKPPLEPFPSLVVTSDQLVAKGSYAQAQAKFLFPDENKVEELVRVMKEKRIGVVAHFYMDPEVQGVLTAAQKHWPHIRISDSLVMADEAVRMAEAGCQHVTVLGVDFMSENVRAILDQAGFPEVGVYRMSDERIGCSLADAAASPAYMNYLQAASTSPPSLHVVYINTSLETKAHAHELVPTITCTSSNVVQTILQAFAQVPELNIYYGPDSYMGANIAELFRQMACMTDEEIAEIHPRHDRNSIRSLLPRLHYYQDGACIVHDLFGHEVVKKIQEMYCDAHLTAHFEVPGEMFSLAMEAKKRGMGVVGSTQNILDFIKNRLQEALDRNVSDHLQFVLGTESGMITSIVAAVRTMLNSSSTRKSEEAKISIEIVFPVSTDSVSRTSTSSSLNGVNPFKSSDLFNLPVVPGVSAGEGCSLHGGCASCPYMKMNSLSALSRICHQLPDKDDSLSAYKANRFQATTPLGNSVAEIGCQPILHMRHFQKNGELPDQLVSLVLHQSCAR